MEEARSLPQAACNLNLNGRGADKRKGGMSEARQEREECDRVPLTSTLPAHARLDLVATFPSV